MMKIAGYTLASILLSVMLHGIFIEYISTPKYHVINLPIPRTAALNKPNDLDAVQVDCMAQNIFFEARGESATGKAMVGLVVLERTRSPHFPSTVCGVIKQAVQTEQGDVVKNKCQFSWFCDSMDHTIDFTNTMVEKEWNESYMIAKLVMLGKIKPSIDMDGVTHYHNNKVRPFWARNKNYRLVARIGNHLFYRWKKAQTPVQKLEMPQYAMN